MMTYETMLSEILLSLGHNYKSSMPRTGVRGLAVRLGETKNCENERNLDAKSWFLAHHELKKKGLLIH